MAEYKDRTVFFELSGGTMENITSVQLYYSKTKLPTPGTSNPTIDKISGMEGFWTEYNNG